jgi:predicted ester cyclase
MSEKNKDLIRSYLEALNKDKSPATVNRWIADSDQELKDHITMNEAAFPGYQLIADDMIAEGDKVAVRATVKATHKGALGDIPPTGKDVAFPLLLIYRIGDGKIVEHWMAMDRLALLEQLGVAQG